MAWQYYPNVAKSLGGKTNDDDGVFWMQFVDLQKQMSTTTAVSWASDDKNPYLAARANQKKLDAMKKTKTGGGCCTIM